MFSILAFIGGLACGYFGKPYIDQAVAAFKAWKAARK